MKSDGKENKQESNEIKSVQEEVSEQEGFEWAKNKVCEAFNE